MTPPISARTATPPASQLLAPFLRPFQNPATFRLISVMWLIALASMIFGGMAITPFHPDEATQIAMSRDYADLFLTGNLDAVRYQPTPVDAAAQELRLINGVVNKLLIGLAWHLGGFTVADLNAQWDWGASYEYNVTNGHMPSPELLQTARLPSTLLFVAGLLPMFALGGLVGGRTGALTATLLYALHPALLVNGRRAMMEGSLIFFMLLTVCAAVWLARRRSWLSVLALGGAAGLVLASKHTAVFGVGAVFIGALLALLWGMRGKPAAAVIGIVGRITIAGVLAVTIFYALNPAWWGDPLGRASEVMMVRSRLLTEQTETFGGYANFGEQWAGFARQSLIPEAQYYEVEGWDAAIGRAIVTYEATVFDGVRDLPAGGLEGVFFDLLLPIVVLAGAGWLLVGKSDATVKGVIGGWMAITALTTLLLTPLEWQRYYLLMQLVTILLAAAGVAWSMQSQRGNPETNIL